MDDLMIVLNLLPAPDSLLKLLLDLRCHVDTLALDVLGTADEGAAGGLAAGADGGAGVLAEPAFDRLGVLLGLEVEDFEVGWEAFLCVEGGSHCVGVLSEDDN